MPISWGSLAAGFTAACALVVSAYTAYLQRQQVRAQVWPLLSWDTHSSRGNEKSEFSFGLRNSGVGPAIVKVAEISLDQRPLRRWVDALKVIAPPPDGKNEASYSVSISGIRNRVLAAGESVTAFSPHESPIAARVADEMKRFSVMVCYCSVLDDCWVIRETSDRYDPARPVDACPTPPVPFEE
jgi:hypothetical protein